MKLLPLLFLLSGALFAQTIQNDNPPPFDSQSKVTFQVVNAPVDGAYKITVCANLLGSCSSHVGSISFLDQNGVPLTGMTWTDVKWTHTPTPSQPWWAGCFNSCTDTTRQNVQYYRSTWHWWNGTTVLN